MRPGSSRVTTARLPQTIDRMAAAVTSALGDATAGSRELAPPLAVHSVAGGRPRRVAILGGGPAGAMLGFELARAGVSVGMFAPDNRPPLLVGESLVPAVIPYLRRLGIEDEVRGYSVLKPGATFTLRGADPLVVTVAQFKRIA